MPELKFEDKHEVAFERVKVSGNLIQQVKIQVENINASISNVFRIEESVFPGIEDVTKDDDDKFVLEVRNEQPELDGSTKKCNYDYKGDIIFRRNTFGYLRQGNIYIKGGAQFHLKENSIDIIDGLAFDIINVKHIEVTGNQIGFPIKGTNMLFFYQRSRTECYDDELDLPETAVKGVILKHNRFNRAVSNFFEIDKDPNYSEDFIKKVSMESNEMAQRCNCTKEDMPEEPKINDRLMKMLSDTSR